jgi:two-component system, sensor histidine kinase and response regulator
MSEKIQHILIVDDNPENIRVLGTALRQKNYRLSVAQNGTQALKAVEEQIPDLILLDVMMPGMSGFEVCKALRDNPKTAHVEIIFVTAAIAHSDELKGLELGAVDYIHKPFSIPLVQAKVALHLERANSKRELELKNAALEENIKLRDDIERITRHDLKTPLNALMGYPQLMLHDENLTTEQRSYLEEMLRAGSEMLNLINNSLDLFKMESGTYQYKPELLDMVSVINTIIRDLRMLTETHGVCIQIQVEGLAQDEAQFFLMEAERSLSYTLFANLLRNAVEASKTGDVIVVKMHYEAAGQAVVSIINPSPVPVEIQHCFFDKYATFGKKYGTGLGTYSAKLMTETQQGTIAMTADDKSTCITVMLPYQAVG